MIVVFDAEAVADLEAAQDWYETKRRGLGDKLDAEVRVAIDRIRDNPHAWPKWPDLPCDALVRRFVLVRFPYALAYMVTGDVVVIVAVAHTRRRPYWLHRVRTIS